MSVSTFGFEIAQRQLKQGINGIQLTYEDGRYLGTSRDVSQRFQESVTTLDKYMGAVGMEGIVGIPTATEAFMRVDTSKPRELKGNLRSAKSQAVGGLALATALSTELDYSQKMLLIEQWSNHTTTVLQAKTYSKRVAAYDGLITALVTRGESILSSNPSRTIDHVELGEITESLLLTAMTSETRRLRLSSRVNRLKRVA